MHYKKIIIDIFAGHLPRGRCGLKFVDDDWDFKSKCHLPQGRCGLKFGIALHTDILLPSPSARKVWIEIGEQGK